MAKTVKLFWSNDSSTLDQVLCIAMYYVYLMSQAI